MRMPHLDLSSYALSSRVSLYVIAGAASAAAFIGYQSYNRTVKLARQKAVISSPLTTLLPKLSVEEQKRLPYPPDILPGARDVDSPYGSIRVYEFGPENGRKVLLLHGVSTPCLSLAGVAQKLAGRGCRVMLFGKHNFCLAASWPFNPICRLLVSPYPCFGVNVTICLCQAFLRSRAAYLQLNIFLPFTIPINRIVSVLPHTGIILLHIYI